MLKFYSRYCSIKIISYLCFMFNQNKNDMKITEQTFLQMEDSIKRMTLAIHDLRNETSENIYNLRRKNLALDAFMLFHDASDISEIYDRCVEMARTIEHAYTVNDERR